MASSCREDEIAIAEEEFSPAFSIKRTEWLYEIYPGFKHSYTVLVTQSNRYFITEKNREGVLWYSVDLPFHKRDKRG